jgi:hypothetical protein
MTIQSGKKVTKVPDALPTLRARGALGDAVASAYGFVTPFSRSGGYVGGVAD